MNAPRIPVFQPAIAGNLVEELNACCASRWWGYGRKTAELERRFTAERGGWALAVTSCTTALNLVAQLIGREKDDEVIVPAMTFVSTAMAFHAAGMRPVIADVEPGSLLLDVADVARRITPRTRGVVAVHLYGQRQELAGLRALCDARDIVLIEDCAHRIGSPAEAPVGDFACYSFNAVKEAPAGEGGLLWSRRTESEKVARELSYLGMSVDTLQRSTPSQHLPYEFGERSGGKHRMTDIAAVFVLACLGDIERWRSRRQEIFRAYEQALAGSAMRAAIFPRQAEDSHLMFVVRVSPGSRGRIRQALAERGIATSTHYPSLSRHPLWGRGTAACPVAEAAEAEVLTLPCFPDMDHTSLDRVLAAWRALT